MTFRYKHSLILGTSILALSIFTLPINVNAHPTYKAPVTCYTTNVAGITTATAHIGKQSNERI